MKIFIYDENRVLMRTVGTPDIMQGENNATLIFMSVAGIDESNFQNYLAQFAATIGTSHPADIITDFGTYVLDGVEYKGWKYFVSSKFTQVAGALNANLILSSGGSTLISQTVTLNVNPSASGVTWFKNITQAQWEQLLAYCIGLRNPNLGELSAEGLDSYCNMGQAGGYLYLDDDGLSHLLFVSYDAERDRVYQTDYYNEDGALLCRQRYTTESVDDEWTNWVINSQASAISFDDSNSNLLSGKNTVQKAIAWLEKSVTPISFSPSLALNGFTVVDVPNSKDKKIKDAYGNNLDRDGIEAYSRTKFNGNYNAVSTDKAVILTDDGSIYELKVEETIVAYYLDGCAKELVSQAKAEQALINQNVANTLGTLDSRTKNDLAGMGEITMDSDTYVITLTIKNLNGQVIATSKVDIPAEMAFVSASYDNTTKDLTFTLQNGDEVAVPLDDIVSGLASEAWVNTAIANALLPYATTSWVDSNYMSLTKGGYVNLAEAPSSPNVYYFGAKNGTTSFFRLSDNSFDVKTTRGDVMMQFSLNFSASNLARFVKIDSSTTPNTLSVTDIPFKQGVHSLVLDDDLDEANAKITALETKTAKQESDIQYLYRQVIGGGDLVTETDSGVSLTSQPFPLTVSPKALLDYVGGMCQKVNQLADVRNVTETHHGITMTRNSVGSVAITGTSTFTTGDSNFYDIVLPIEVTYGHKYLFFTDNSKWQLYCYNNGSGTGGVQSFIFTPNATGSLKITVRPIDLSYISSGTVINEVVKVRIVDITDAYPTDTPTSTSDARIQWLMSYLSSHPKYDAGSIITAPVTKVVSKDANGNVVNEYPIPAEVRALEGYGYGLSADCYNEVSFEGKSYGKKVVRVDLGTLNWQYYEPTTKFYANLAPNPQAEPSNLDAKCSKYDVVTGGTSSTEMPNLSIGIHTNGISVYVRDDSFNGDAASFKTAMNGVYLYYELATTVETDISEYIDSDVIVVSAGGHLEFENENDMGVPYSATYQCEPETQGGE